MAENPRNGKMDVRTIFIGAKVQQFFKFHITSPLHGNNQPLPRWQQLDSHSQKKTPKMSEINNKMNKKLIN